MSLHELADQIRRQGRGEDDQLVHFTKGELAGLDGLALHMYGQPLPRNPVTGLPEAGWFKKLLPTILGAAVNFFVPGAGFALSAAIGGLAGAALNKGNPLMGALTGALGGYGGAGLTSALTGAGAAAGAGAAGASAAGGAGAGTAAGTAAGAGMTAAPGATLGSLTPGADAAIAEGLGGGIGTGVAPSASFASPAASTVAAETAGAGLTAPSSGIAGGTGMTGTGLGTNAMQTTVGETYGLAGGTGMTGSLPPPEPSMWDKAVAGASNVKSGDVMKAVAPLTMADEPKGGGGGAGAINVIDRDYTFDPSYKPGADRTSRESLQYGGLFSLVKKPKKKKPIGGAQGGVVGLAKGGATSAGALDYLMGDTKLGKNTQGGATSEGVFDYLMGGKAPPPVVVPQWTPPVIKHKPVMDEDEKKPVSPIRRPGDMGGGTPVRDPRRFLSGEDRAKGGIVGSYAAGGSVGCFADGGPVELETGGFVFPADVVSAIGAGSSSAGLDELAKRFGARGIVGPGHGQSDHVSALIDGHRPARVARDEAVLTAEQVARIGGGDAKKGAKKLYAMMDTVRQRSMGTKKQMRPVSLKELA